MTKPTYLTGPGRVAVTALAAVAVMALGVLWGSPRADAVPVATKDIAILVYPSGKLLHTTDGKLVCVVAVGHPARDTEVHCVPRPMQI